VGCGAGGVDDDAGAGVGAAGAGELKLLLELLLWRWRRRRSVTAAAGRRRWWCEQYAQWMLAAEKAAVRGRGDRTVDRSWYVLYLTSPPR
jgi:hypothetical protein